MPKGSGYWIKLTLTKEMRIALTQLAAQEGSSRDFVQALKALRLGLIAYGVLDVDALQSMYRRKKLTDDEVQFLLEEGFVKEDFRPIPIERIHQAAELNTLNTQFRNVIESWEGLKESSKIYWMKEARKYPDVPNANKLVAMVKELASK